MGIELEVLEVTVPGGCGAATGDASSPRLRGTLQVPVADAWHGETLHDKPYEAGCTPRSGKVGTS
jgi:hypothetical protein